MAIKTFEELFQDSLKYYYTCDLFFEGCDAMDQLRAGYPEFAERLEKSLENIPIGDAYHQLMKEVVDGTTSLTPEQVVEKLEAMNYTRE